MAIRYNSKSKSSYGVEGIKTGLDGNQTTEYTIPSVGIEDVDISLFNLFDKEISFSVNGKEGTQKVPVIFASGEKWALLKKGKPLRDKTNTLILPLITIVRTNIEQNIQSDITGRGINQQTGELVVKRRLSKNDRDYQNLINKHSIQNQISAKQTRDISSFVLGDIEEGALLAPDLKSHNIFEIFVLPSPQFFSAKYEITIWTQYTQHMNEIIEQIFSSFLPQGQCWRLETDKGYWFIATIEDGNFSPENNFDDMSKTERMIKTKINVNVPAYCFSSNTPGKPISVKRYISAPSISFETIENFDSDDTVTEPFLGSDDPTLPLEIKSNRLDQRKTGSTNLVLRNEINENDPVIIVRGRNKNLAKFKKITYKNSKGDIVTKHIRILKNGETIIPNDIDLSKLEINFD